MFIFGIEMIRKVSQIYIVMAEIVKKLMLDQQILWQYLHRQREMHLAPIKRLHSQPTELSKHQQLKYSSFSKCCFFQQEMALSRSFRQAQMNFCRELISVLSIMITVHEVLLQSKVISFVDIEPEPIIESDSIAWLRIFWYNLSKTTITHKIHGKVA